VNMLQIRFNPFPEPVVQATAVQEGLAFGDWSL
jgi:hypothetical protein